MWTITEFLKKGIDGCYSRMLLMALNVDWREHRTDKEVFGSLPRAKSELEDTGQKNEVGWEHTAA